ncbi:cupin domain-containing protein [Nonomuraea turcica]|uniref:cupin domain-containing protein n=1 Tax=Nonomuraea sp. G32 TaxID=3067274 RepID=UPI00273CD744|nr:cupin domain-containing protein [Nonomuraea sp. G32]MDP4501504.1 cupin domain-containing protein [Nonomuraea sp. G32]
MSLLKAEALLGQTAGRMEGSFLVAEWSDPGSTPGYIAPPHRHLRDDEIWYVLEGTLRFRLGDDEVEAEAGAAVVGPAGVPHTFWNPSRSPARYLVVMSPGTVRLIEEVHSVPDRSGERLRELFERHGCEYLPDLWAERG